MTCHDGQTADKSCIVCHEDPDGKLPEDHQPKARRLGLFLAMFIRVLLLISLAWIIRLTAPLFSVMDHPISGRDLILLAGVGGPAVSVREDIARAMYNRAYCSREPRAWARSPLPPAGLLLMS